MANELIPAFEPGNHITATVGAGGVVGKTFVDLSVALNPVTGVNPTVVTATAAGKVVGVATRDAAAGAKIDVFRVKGAIIPVTAGGTIALGAEVEIGSNGRVVTLASGKAVGRAWSAGTSGNDVFIELY